MFIQRCLYYKSSGKIQEKNQSNIIANIFEIFKVKKKKSTFTIKKNINKNKNELKNLENKINNSFQFFLYLLCLNYFSTQSIISSLDQLNIKSTTFSLKKSSLIQLITVFENVYIKNLTSGSAQNNSIKKIRSVLKNLEIKVEDDIQYSILNENLKTLAYLDIIFLEIFSLFLQNIYKIVIEKDKKNAKFLASLESKYKEVSIIFTDYKWTQTPVLLNSYLSTTGLFFVLNLFKSDILNMNPGSLNTENCNVIQNAKSIYPTLDSISINQFNRIQQYKIIFDEMLKIQNNESFKLETILKSLESLNENLQYLISINVLQPNNMLI